jgi:hypothetical protein
MEINIHNTENIENKKSQSVKHKKLLRDENIDEFQLLKSYMDKTGVYEVMSCTGCGFSKNSNLGKVGTFCTMGTRKIRKLDENIVCLDCTENRFEKITVSKEVFKNLEDNLIVKTQL